MSQENVEIVRAAYEAFNRRERQDLLSLVGEDFVVDFSRSPGPERGIYEGHSGLSSLLDTYWEAFAEFRIEPTELIEHGEAQVVAVTHGRAVGRGSGATAEARAAHVWSVRNGLPRRWTVYQTRAEALEAVGLSE